MAEVFLYAMAFGFHRKKRTPLSERVPNIVTSVLGDAKWLIRSMAIADAQGLEILLSPKEIATVAEEYANGGIELLHEIVLSGLPGDPDRRLDSEVRKLLGKNGKVKS